jgi:hypothetical protein
MPAFPRSANIFQSVINVFNTPEERLTTGGFQKLFPVILTGNGLEFSNPAALGTSPVSGERRAKIFYRAPCSSWQKGHAENNRLTLRKDLPKGGRFENLTQEGINLMPPHVSSLTRKSLTLCRRSLFLPLFTERIFWKTRAPG